MSITIIKSYPRIHIGLLELSGKYNRTDGGAGFAVSSFPMTVSVCDASSLKIVSDNLDAQRICKNVLADLKSVFPLKPMQITIESASKLHLGLGFSTQCALTVGFAVLSHHQISFSKDQLIRYVHRGGTSGIGIHSFFHGGFLVDGGHSFPDSKNALGPSSQYTPVSIPPLIIREPFPQWKVCIAIPHTNKVLGGVSEIEFWEKNTPIPEAESNYLCKNLLLGILPALREKNFQHFCLAIQNSTLFGLKKREIAYWQPQYNICSNIMRKNGWSGITLSSLGPSMIGFSNSSVPDSQLYEKLKESALFSEICITTAKNSGFEIFSEEE